jgi:uncharacterized membrane protein YkvA (DUF1232 family)
VLGVIRRIPAYLRLLGGLLTDRRVSTFDKALVGLAVAYIVMPFDGIPDFIPFLGEVDDVFVLVMALQRLVGRAGRAVLEDHWDGDPDELSDGALERVVGAARFFLPTGIVRRLSRLVRGAGRPAEGVRRGPLVGPRETD